MSSGRRLAGRSDIDPALNFLIERRVRSKLTQLQVAKALHVSQAVVSSWENGRVDPTLSQARQYAAVLGVLLVPVLEDWL